MRKWGLLIVVLAIFTVLNADDSTYTHIKGFSEFSFNRQSVSGTVSGYNWQPYSNRNNRTNLLIESALGNDLYFSGNILSNQTALEDGVYSFSLRHRYGMAKIGQFVPEINGMTDKALMKGILVKGNYENNEITGQYFFNNIAFTKEKIEGNGTEGPFRLKYADLINGSETVELIDKEGKRTVLRRNNDYSINYIAGDIELKNRILENNELLIVKYETKNGARYRLEEAHYAYWNQTFGLGIEGIDENSRGDSISRDNKKFTIHGTYNRSGFKGNMEFGRSFSDSTTPIYIKGDVGFAQNGFDMRVGFKRKEQDYSLFDGSKSENYGVQGGYANERIMIKGGYNTSFEDSINIKRIAFVSGINIGKNIVSYNYTDTRMNSYASKRHFLKLSSDLPFGKTNIESGIGNMEIDTVGNRNYFINGSMDINRYINMQINSENRYEIYRDSSLYRYRQFLSIAKNGGKSNVYLNLGVLNDETGRNIPYGRSRINIAIRNFANIKVKLGMKRINGKLDSVYTPVNHMDIFPEITFNNRYLRFTYNPQLCYGIYDENQVQEKRTKSGGIFRLKFGKVSSQVEYYRYRNISFDLNNLTDKMTDNFGSTGRFGINADISQAYSMQYAFDYNRDNGLFNVVIPTETDTSGDTIEIVKTSRKLRHNLNSSFRKGESMFNLKTGYENNDEYHGDTLYGDYRMIDETAEVGKTFFEGFELFAGIYTNAKKGFDAEIAQDSGWSYSIGPQFRAEYSGKYGAIYSNYKYIQAYGASEAKINEFKFGGNLRINMFGISTDCYIRKGIIPIYNINRISLKIGIYY